MKHVLLLAVSLSWSWSVVLGCSEKKPEEARPRKVASETSPSDKTKPSAASAALGKTEVPEEFFAKKGFVKSAIWSIADFEKACKGDFSKVPNPNFKKKRRLSVFPEYDYVCDDVRFETYERNPEWKKEPANHWRTGYTLKSVNPKTKEHESGPVLTWSRKHFPHDGRQCRKEHFCNGKPFVKESPK